MWSGGSKVKKMMNDPLLLTYPPSEGGGGSGSANTSRFKNARGPGGLGYDSMAKCELRGLTITLTLVESQPYCAQPIAYQLKSRIMT